MATTSLWPRSLALSRGVFPSSSRRSGLAPCRSRVYRHIEKCLLGELTVSACIPKQHIEEDRVHTQKLYPMFSLHSLNSIYTSRQQSSCWAFIKGCCWKKQPFEPYKRFPLKVKETIATFAT
jgi:hypothetical protein